jgi:hypothetical protein
LPNGFCDCAEAELIEMTLSEKPIIRQEANCLPMLLISDVVMKVVILHNVDFGP